MLSCTEIEAVLPKCRTLEGAEALDGLSPADIYTMTNGVGAEWMDAFSFGGRTLSDVFNHRLAWAVPAAIVHDVKYTIGGTEEERRKADDEFLRNCLHLAGWWRFWRRAEARAMHRLCRAFGDMAWERI